MEHKCPIDPQTAIETCVCCGSQDIGMSSILWRELIDEWGLNESETRYIDRQQGLHCGKCGCNLRAMALATAIMRAFSFRGLFANFVNTRVAKRLRILEINEAGNLTQYLRRISGHVISSYPDINILQMPFMDGSFDLVIHSDTLEHISDPTKALSECHRVLIKGGYCVFTVPIVVGRLSRSRINLPPSYHGSRETHQQDLLVYTEFGSDVWQYIFFAGFTECRISALEYPAGLALVAVKGC